MKKVFLTLFILSLSFCRAQTTYSLLDEGVGLLPGAYYKDTHNELDKFVGTWKYQSGNVIFEITLQKKIMLYDTSFNNYADMLIGEYRYAVNGTAVVNTMSTLAFNLEPYENNISGAYIMDKNKPAFSRRVMLYFTDPERSYLNRSIIVKHLVAQGNVPERIEIEFKGEMSIAPNDNSPTSLRVPEQDYILTKVN